MSLGCVDRVVCAGTVPIGRHELNFKATSYCYIFIFCCVFLRQAIALTCLEGATVLAKGLHGSLKTAYLSDPRIFGRIVDSSSKEAVVIMHMSRNKLEHTRDRHVNSRLTQKHNYQADL